MPPFISCQALILCGPGESLNPFVVNVDEHPKALVCVGNRPMVWYALDWCYRTGVSNVSIVAPISTVPALDAALSQNPYLTSLSGPRPSILSPQALSYTSGTAEIMRMPEIQDALVGDFIVLPCDILCDINGSKLFEAWHSTEKPRYELSPAETSVMGVYYETTVDQEGAPTPVKDGETNLLITTGGSASSKNRGILSTEEVLITLPTSTMKDTLSENAALAIRRAAFEKSGCLRVRKTVRDAHMYFFPQLVKQYFELNDTFDTIGEDAIGWLAKARWQSGLRQKLGFEHMRELQPNSKDEYRRPAKSDSAVLDGLEFEPPRVHAHVFTGKNLDSYVRRVDTKALLLSTSLHIAKLNRPLTGEPASPFSHESKIHPTSVPGPSIKITIDTTSVLVDANVILTSKSTIKESVIGAGCVLGSPINEVATEKGKEAQQAIPPGVRLQRCLLMENVELGSGCNLTGCIIGKRCKIGRNCDLKDCYVQDFSSIPDGTQAKGETFASFGEQQDVDEDDFASGDDDIMA